MILTGPSPDLRPLHPGRSSGELLVLSAPLSFWGGVDRYTGVVIDVHHPEHGKSLAGRVVAMRAGRGSSSSSSVLAEVLRNGRGPAALLLREADLIVSLGVIVAADLYGCLCPVLVLGATAYTALRSGDTAQVEVEAGQYGVTGSVGTLSVTPGSAVSAGMVRTIEGEIR